jgi:hypothetical protein
MLSTTYWGILTLLPAHLIVITLFYIAALVGVGSELFQAISQEWRWIIMLRINRRSLCGKITAFMASSFVLGAFRTANAAPTAVGLQCTTNDGAEPRRTFALNFNPGNGSWSESEPGSTSDIFRTKSGNFVTVANVTSLRRNGPGDTVVGILNNFNPSTAQQGDTGSSGRALETARTFDWTVILVIP